MIVNQIHHGGITVRDTDESIAFYENVFGFKKMGECDLSVDTEGGMKGVRIRISFLKAGDGELEILQYLSPSDRKQIDANPWDTGAQHLSFKVSNVRELYEKHRDTVHFLTPPVDYKAEGIDTTWTYLKDPNGAIIELSEDHGERGYRSGA